MRTFVSIDLPEHVKEKIFPDMSLDCRVFSSHITSVRVRYIKDKDL